jgi:hypothetical protein
MGASPSKQLTDYEAKVFDEDEEKYAILCKRALKLRPGASQHTLTVETFFILLVIIIVTVLLSYAIYFIISGVRKRREEFKARFDWKFNQVVCDVESCEHG